MIVSQPSIENRFCPRNFVLRNRSNCSAEISFQRIRFLDFRVDRIRVHEFAANLLAQPDLFFFALNVPVFGADFAAVRALKNVQNLAQRGLFSAAQTASDEDAIEIPDRQAVGFDVEFRMIEQRQRVQRIDVGNEVSAHAIGVD